MGIVTIGIFTFNEQGVQGALFRCCRTASFRALFLVVGEFYDGSIPGYRSLRQPRRPDAGHALVFMAFTMATMGLPATSGSGEFLVIIGRKSISGWLLGGLGMVLGTAHAYRGSFWHHYACRSEEHLDLNPREGGVRAADA